MRIRFDVAGTPCEFHRNTFLRSAELRIGPDTFVLRRAVDPRVWFDLDGSRNWERNFGGHAIRIEMTMPRTWWIVGSQRHYCVFIDGQPVAEETGL